MRYIGGKNQGGTWRRIVNLIPPHEIYIEGCLGSGAILRMKAPAAQSYGVDKVDTMFPALDRAAPNLVLERADILTWLQRFKWPKGKRVFIYLDPPYLATTRRGGRYYKIRRK